MKVLKIIINHTINNLLRLNTTKFLLTFLVAVILVSMYFGVQDMNTQHQITTHYSQEVRQKWEENPDKHPHRMAHYGYVVFRKKYPLSFFDGGIDAYTGKAVFLEAHKQNGVNFSEASQSNSLLRFGQLSPAMLLQVLFPLVIFFFGYDLIAKEREDGTLKLLLTQGIVWKHLLLGKTIGLFLVGLMGLLPVFLVGVVFLFYNKITIDVNVDNIDMVLRYVLLFLFYVVYVFVFSAIAIYVSAKSITAKTSLLVLVGFWLLCVLILPRISQVLGQNLYDSPSKIEFDVAVETELVKQGDSHNPDDAHYVALKDSVLKANNVTDTKKLPFNYGGFVMKEGEKMSSYIFEKHQKKLTQIYISQQNIPRVSAFVNPFMAIKHISMGLSGTDYASFIHFEQEAEKFRYRLAQTMNELQMKYISNQVKNSADKHAKLNKKHWVDFPDFSYKFIPVKNTMQAEWISFFALFGWLVAIFSFMYFFDKGFKAI